MRCARTGPNAAAAQYLAQRGAPSAGSSCSMSCSCFFFWDKFVWSYLFCFCESSILTIRLFVELWTWKSEEYTVRRMREGRALVIGARPPAPAGWVTTSGSSAFLFIISKGRAGQRGVMWVFPFLLVFLGRSWAVS